jgi:hypothetical protein
MTWQLIADTANAVLGRIQWPIVLERLLTRLTITGLRWIQRLSTNTVVDETIDLIASMLEEKKLIKAKEYQQQKDKREGL